MKAYELTSWLEKKYPSDAAEDWDNVGLLAGDDTNEISHVFLALDLTEETLAEAIEDGADMIITHHPMIFSGIKKINNPIFIAPQETQINIARDGSISCNPAKYLLNSFTIK